MLILKKFGQAESILSYLTHHKLSSSGYPAMVCVLLPSPVSTLPDPHSNRNKFSHAITFSFIRDQMKSLSVRFQPFSCLDACQGKLNFNDNIFVWFKNISSQILK